MAPIHPCNDCYKKQKCKYIYNRDKCKTLKKKTLDITDNELRILESQLEMMFVNLPPKLVANTINKILYVNIAAGTSNAVATCILNQLKEHSWEGSSENEIS